MWFKNLRIYNIEFDLVVPLEAALNAHKFVPCGNLDVSRYGFVPPLGDHGVGLIHITNGCIMICAKHQEKVFPGAVIKSALEEKIKELKAQGYTPGRKERQDLKDEIIFSLLPRAFVRDRLDFAYIDTKEQRLIVNAASAKRAESLIHVLRLAIGSLKCTPFECDRGAESLLTEWVRQGYADAPFALGEECELKAPKDGRTIRAKKEDLSSDEIRAHLAAGLNVQKSALLWGEELTFVLGPDLSINRLKFQDVLREQAGDRKAESVEEEFDTTFFIMSETLRWFVKDLAGALGGEVGNLPEGEFI
jgi:recombination associated protein RdgC